MNRAAWLENGRLFQRGLVQRRVVQAQAQLFQPRLDPAAERQHSNSNQPFNVPARDRRADVVVEREHLDDGNAAAEARAAALDAPGSLAELEAVPLRRVHARGCAR